MQSSLEDACSVMASILTSPDNLSCSQFFKLNNEFNTKLYYSTLRLFAKPKIHTFISTCESNQVKCTASLYINLLKNKETAFYAEKKYDGERMQIHFSQIDKKISIFSKSGRDSTTDRICSHEIIQASLGIKNDLSIKMNITRNEYMIDVHECIIEGELLVYNELDSKIERFGGVPDFRKLFGKNLKNNDKRHYCIAFFDILHINNETLLNAPFCERRKYLRNVIQPFGKYVLYMINERRFYLKYKDLNCQKVS